MKILSLILMGLMVISCANRDVVNSAEDTESEFRDTIKIKQGQEFVVVGYVDPEQPMKVKNIKFVDAKAKEQFMNSLKANKGATVVKPDGNSYKVNINKKFDPQKVIYADDTKMQNLDDPIAKEPIIIKSNATEQFKKQVKKNKQ